jgi:hypothetical protein
MATMLINGALQGSYKYATSAWQAIRTIAGRGDVIRSPGHPTRVQVNKS